MVLIEFRDGQSFTIVIAVGIPKDIIQVTEDSWKKKTVLALKNPQGILSRAVQIQIYRDESDRSWIRSQKF